MCSVKERLIRYVDDHQDEMIDFLQQLTRIPSDNPPGDCLRIAKFIDERLREYGFADTSYLELSEQEAAEVNQAFAVNVLASTVFGEGGPQIALSAHGDVVPPGLGWTHDPYGGEIIDGRLYGRGAAVSKSDIAAYTFAVLALRETLSDLPHKNGKVVLAFNFDEETGGLIGPKWLLDKEYIKPDMAIAAGFTHVIVNAHNGCLHLEVKVTGRSAHAALPETGNDALEATTGVLQALYSYRKTLQGIQSNVSGIESPTLVVGYIEGGINTNVVPDECVIRLDRRMIPEEDPQVVEAQLCALIEEAVLPYEGITVRVNRLLLARNLPPVPEDTPLVRALVGNWSLQMGGQPRIEAVPLYTDARHFAEYGIPVVMFGAGPRKLEEANGHRADEHVKIEDLVAAAKIVTCTLYDLLEGAEGG